MANLEIVKKVQNCILYKDNKGERFIRIDNVRLSFPFVGTPAEDENDDGQVSEKWRLVAMAPKDTHEAAHGLIEQVINKIITENDARVPRDKWFMTDGDEKEAEEMNGNWLISASDGKYRPRARDRAGRLIDDIAKIDETFYGGCWASVMFRPWFFNGKSKKSTKTYPKRVSAGLVAVMFMRDDTPFGNSRIDDTDSWGDLADNSAQDPMDDDDGL